MNRFILCSLGFTALLFKEILV